MRSLLKYWVPLYVYAGFIFYLSSVPRALPDIGIPFLDKILHVCGYAVFGLIASRAFRNSSRKVFLENFKIFAILVSIAYGISDEFHQALVPGRQFSIFDMIADGIGGVIGVFAYGRYHSI